MKFLKKVAQHLQELRPTKSRIFFIYTHKNGFDRFNNGLKANTEISYWSYQALQKEFPSVVFLRLDNEKASRIARIRPEDIVIGHPGPTYLAAAQRTKRIISFSPWAGHEDRSQEKFNCMPKEKEWALYDKAQSLILLTSEYNKDKYIDKACNYWFSYLQKKRIRIVHQPIDLTLFPRIKNEYTTNNFLYIGNDAHMKCLNDSKALVAQLGKTLTIYGMKGKKINHLDAKAIGHLTKEADFFIQPGMWEAQCVSILEAAARGFIPVVSPETGYPYDHPFLLRYNDHEYNIKTLQKLLNTPPQERKELADILYNKLIEDENHNQWERLTKVLVEEVKRLL